MRRKSPHQRSAQEVYRVQKLSRQLKAEGRLCDDGCGRVGETVHHLKPTSEGGTLDDGWKWLCWCCHEYHHRAKTKRHLTRQQYHPEGHSCHSEVGHA